MSEIDCRYYQRRGEVKRRRIFFDESGRLHGACLLRRHSTPMILWRPIFVIAGLDPAIHAASRIHHGPPGQARWWQIEKIASPRTRGEGDTRTIADGVFPW